MDYLEELREKRDELADPISTIQTAIWNINRKDLAEDIRNILIFYEDELEDLEKEIEELERQESEDLYNEENRLYNSQRL